VRHCLGCGMWKEVLRLKHWEKVPLCLIVPDFRKSTVFWKVLRLRPLVLLVSMVLSWRSVWNIGGMILTGENRSTGREMLYSVGGRCMNGYGEMVEWYWQGKTEVLGVKPVTVTLCPPQIAHGLTWNWIWASSLTGRRLKTYINLNSV